MGGVVGEYLSQFWGIPFVHTEHTSGLIFASEQYTNKDKQLLRKVYGNSLMNVFVSNYAMVEILQKYGIEKSANHCVIHNLIDNSFFNARRSSIESTAFKYVNISNIVPRKGHIILFKAWKILLDKFPNSTLTIAGKGSSLNEVKNLASSLNLNSSIVWKPRLDREEVKREIQNNHVVVSSSIVETFGLILAESIALGVPVVSTDSGGVRDFINNNNGFITERSAEALAEGMIKIQEQYSRFLKDDVSQSISSISSSKVIGDKLEGLYSAILN